MDSSVVASVRNLSSNFLFVLELCFKLMGLLAYFSHCLTTNTRGWGGTEIDLGGKVRLNRLLEDLNVYQLNRKLYTYQSQLAKTCVTKGDCKYPGFPLKGRSKGPYLGEVACHQNKFCSRVLEYDFIYIGGVWKEPTHILFVCLFLFLFFKLLYLLSWGVL